MLTFLLIVVTAIFVVAGLSNGSFANLQPFWAPGGFSPSVYGIAAVLVTTPFWYAGFNVLPQALAEKSHTVGSRSVRLAMLTSIAAAGIFYIAVILAGAAVLPRSELLAQSMPAAGAFQAAFASPLGAAAGGGTAATGADVATIGAAAAGGATMVGAGGGVPWICARISASSVAYCAL